MKDPLANAIPKHANENSLFVAGGSAPRLVLIRFDFHLRHVERRSFALSRPSARSLCLPRPVSPRRPRTRRELGPSRTAPARRTHGPVRASLNAALAGGQGLSAWTFGLWA